MMNPVPAITGLLFFFAANFASAQAPATPITPHLTATTPATPPAYPPDQSESSRSAPSITVQKALGTGKKMVALLTTITAGNPNSTITNANGSIPIWTGTVQAGTQGISFVVPGVVNHLPVTDLHINGVDTDTRTGLDKKLGILTILAFVDNGAGGLSASVW